LPRRKADDDVDGTRALLDAERIASVAAKVEVDGHLAGVVRQGNPQDAVQGEVADLAAGLIPRGHIPVAAVIEDVARMNPSVRCPSAREAAVADKRHAAPAEGVEHVGED